MTFASLELTHKCAASNLCGSMRWHPEAIIIILTVQFSWLTVSAYCERSKAGEGPGSLGTRPLHTEKEN